VYIHNGNDIVDNERSLDWAIIVVLRYRDDGTAYLCGVGLINHRSKGHTLLLLYQHIFKGRDFLTNIFICCIMSKAFLSVPPDPFMNYSLHFPFPSLHHRYRHT
jgi:hypothetical protein